MRELVLANGENVVKKYTYVKYKKNKKTVECESSLIVTDKRVIKETIADDYVSRHEMPVSAVDFIDCGVKKQTRSLKQAIISAILAVIIFAGGVTLGFTAPIQSIDPMIPSYVCYGFGIIAMLLSASFFILWIRSTGCSLDVVLMSHKERNALFGARIKSDYDVHSRLPKLKMEVDREVAETMVDELSAVIFSMR